MHLYVNFVAVCQLYAAIGVDAGVGKYWLEKAEQLYPQSEEVFKLKVSCIDV
jgi:hypothetical protein